MRTTTSSAISPLRRILYAAIGASVALVATVGYRAADFPGTGGHPELVLRIAILIGALVGFLAWTRFAAFLAIVVGVAVAVVTLTGAVRAPVRSWIRHDPMPSPGATVDAVVVLSADVNGDGFLDGVGAERLVAGLQVTQRAHPRFLVTSRVTQRVGSRTVISDGDQAALIAMAGDTKLWHVIWPVSSTHDEALRTAALLTPASSHTIALVTSPLHSRRACATFERVGFHVLCLPSPERIYAVYALNSARSRLHAFLDYLYERAAMVKYRWKGWVR